MKLQVIAIVAALPLIGATCSADVVSMRASVIRAHNRSEAVAASGAWLKSEQASQVRGVEMLKSLPNDFWVGVAEVAGGLVSPVVSPQPHTREDWMRLAAVDVILMDKLLALSRSINGGVE